MYIFSSKHFCAELSKCAYQYAPVHFRNGLFWHLCRGQIKEGEESKYLAQRKMCSGEKHEILNTLQLQRQSHRTVLPSDRSYPHPSICAHNVPYIRNFGFNSYKLFTTCTSTCVCICMFAIIYANNSNMSKRRQSARLVRALEFCANVVHKYKYVFGSFLSFISLKCIYLGV